MPDELHVTREGYERLEQALDRERQRREDNIASMAGTLDDATDLENRSLNAAQLHMERPGVEARILELEDALARAVIVDPGELPRDEVTVGSVVVLHAPDQHRELTVQLVSAVEIATLAEGVTQVSDDSPVGQALRGRHRGETFTVELDSGPVRYTVRRISVA
ncbi:GreA/GreB family elongation factor [Deinococcus aquaedulcis]|uniref:GreA/GreB family elongation factor n=1 Tax=Deinococcus aquaedulcis TaxID=2840455 RepID=UPI001C8320E6|nr:GreA/GreB family elongation factor [Deinococcus aquaedulcis]